MVIKSPFCEGAPQAVCYYDKTFLRNQTVLCWLAKGRACGKQFSFLTLLPHHPNLGKKAAGTEAHGYGLSTQGVGPLASERCSVGQVLGNSDEGLGRVILK